jgi:hypothetical protein
MAYDEKLATRVRDALPGGDAWSEKKMFGGVGFLLAGNMCCGVHKNDLILRLGPEATDAALDEPHVRVFDLTGRAMTGWVVVGAGGTENDDALHGWVERATAYVATLPPK